MFKSMKLLKSEIISLYFFGVSCTYLLTMIHCKAPVQHHSEAISARNLGLKHAARHGPPVDLVFLSTGTPVRREVGAGLY